MELGAYVYDVDDPDPDLAVVVDRPDATIADVTVTDSDGNERTVAEDNPDYAGDEAAVVVSFVESGLNEHWPAWTVADPAAYPEGTREHGVRRYTFPESRLEPLEPGSVPDDTPLRLTALHDRLGDAGWTLRVADGVLVADRMDDQYRIHPTGEVEGDGDFRTPLENIVDQYLQ